MKQLFTLSIFFFSFFLMGKMKAQDLIVKKDGSRIFCRIVFVDSSSIQYFKTAQKTRSVISRTEVESFFTQAVGKNKFMKPDTLQKRKELLILHISAGFANPLGNFASKDIEKDYSGLANTGYRLHGSAILKVASFFGFCAAYDYQKNSVDNASIESSYASTFGPNVNVSIKTTHWINHGFFGGLYFSAPLKDLENLSLDFTLLGGLPKFKSPELSITLSQPGISMNILQSVGETQAPAFIGKMALRYKIERVAISFGASYLYAKPSFNNVLITDSYGGYGYAKFDQKITSLNVDLGLSFLIFK